MGLETEDITALYASEARKVVAYFARRTYDAELAVELMAETFADAMAGRARFRNGGSPEAWLWGIARHQLAHWVRHRTVERRALTRLGLEPPQLSDAELERVEELIGSEQLRADVNEQLHALASEQRTALQLRVVEERPYEEVARVMGVSEQAARARVSRGLKALGRAMAESGHAG